LFTDDDVVVADGTTEHSVSDPFSPGATVCNLATVTCDGGAGPLDAQTAEAVCPVSEGGCLTRTPGFWKSHVNVVDAVIPVVSCGLELTTQNAVGPANDGPFSTSEDLCINNNEAKDGTSPGTSSQQFQIIRQCAAAALNLEASRQLELSCSTAAIDSSIPFGDIEARFATCCGVGDPTDGGTRGVCNDNKTVAQINASGCIGYLDAFNNANFDEGDGEDSLADLDPDWNDVDTAQCDIADANRFLNDSDENDGRSYGPK
jgi:hypothetical protein